MQSNESNAGEAVRIVTKHTFRKEFMEILETLAKTTFSDFASDATNNGFPAQCSEGEDSDGNPYMSVRFLLNREGKLGEHPENECLFVLKGLLKEKMVEITAAYDQRPGKNGAGVDRQDLMSTNQISLEDSLTAFLQRALDAHQPHQPRMPD